MGKDKRSAGGGLFDNPPYDQALSGQRMEVEYLRHDLALLGVGRLGIWVFPKSSGCAATTISRCTSSKASMPVILPINTSCNNLFRNEK